MNISIFVTIWMTAVSSMSLNDHFLGDPLSSLKANADVSAVEFYTPIGGNAPKTPGKGDVPPPNFMIEVQLNSEDAAVALSKDSAFIESFVSKNGLLKNADKITLDVLEVVNYDIPGHDSPPPREAPFSFVVRYHGPVDNAAEFTDNYINTHPERLAQFPKIRNVLCYLPLGWRDRGAITDGGLIHGNEAVFDSFEDFKASAKSEAMQAVRENASKFKDFGYGAHTPMERKLVYKR